MRRYTPFLLLPALAFIIAAQNSDRQVQQEAQQKVREAFQSSVGEQLKSTLSEDDLDSVGVMAQIMSRAEQAAALKKLRALEYDYRGSRTAQAELAKGYYAVAYAMQKEGKNKDARTIALKAYEMVKNNPRSPERTLLINFLKTVRDEDARPRDETAGNRNTAHPALGRNLDTHVGHVLSDMGRTGTGSDVLIQAARTQGRRVTLKQLRKAGIDVQLAEPTEMGGKNAQVVDRGNGRFTIKINRETFEANQHRSPEALAALFTENVDNAVYDRDTDPGFFSRIIRDVQGKIKGVWVAVELNQKNGHNGVMLKPSTPLAQGVNFLISLWRDELKNHKDENTEANIGRDNFDNMQRPIQNEMFGWKGILAVHQQSLMSNPRQNDPGAAMHVPQARKQYEELYQADEEFQRKNNLNINNH